MFEYPLRLEDDETDSGEPAILVTAPDLPGFVSAGDTVDGACLQARDALIVWAWQQMDKGLDMPPASPAAGRPTVQLPTGAALKVLIHQAMRADGVSRADLARRLGRDEKVVRRILDFGHASPPDQLDDALRALGRRPVISVAPLEPAA
ncbi:MAG: type II toxin-antitoxin system HicB family antitoxin [Alphaproteobacteria bacterium]|jgi:antitoxin HicB|nr:type II toxin-antitoxin system HicB family antitoxin [Alphaproteobacteria bacterium]